jgi:hypothetical protein
MPALPPKGDIREADDKRTLRRLSPKADMVQHDRKQTFLNAVVARAFVFFFAVSRRPGVSEKGGPFRASIAGAWFDQALKTKRVPVYERRSLFGISALTIS